MSDIIKEVTDQTFGNEVLKSSNPVLVDFWAPWCGPCRMLTPILTKLASQYQGKLKVVKLNTDENPDTATTYNISAIPTLLFFNGGQMVNQIIGVKPPDELKKIIDEVLPLRDSN
ncbi:MAG: thioredoxin [Planctomycetota bacterium]